MSNYSTLPEVHHMMESLPYIGTFWHEAITNYPSYHHLSWSLLFAILSGAIHLFSCACAKLFVPYLMGFSKTPPITRDMKPNQRHYMKLGKACDYTQTINIQHYDLDRLSSEYCEGKLSSQSIKRFLVYCNEHHSDIAKNEQRFAESLFHVISKCCTLFYGISGVYNKQWLYQSSLYFVGWPHNQQLDCCAADIKLLYMMHMGWYLWMLWTQIRSGRHSNDFWASMIHHVTAIILIALSYNHGLMRVGVVVLLLHDPADFILQTGKLFRLMKFELVMNICFASLIISWLITRLVLFPYLCIWSGAAFYYETENNIVLCCCVCMCCLLLLHVHWFRLLVLIVMRTLYGAELKDIRSDDEGSGIEQKHDE